MTSKWYWRCLNHLTLFQTLPEAVEDAHSRVENYSHWVVARVAPRVEGSSWGDYVVLADEHGYPSREDALKSWAADDGNWVLLRAVVSFQQVTSIDTTWYAEAP